MNPTIHRLHLFFNAMLRFSIFATRRLRTSILILCSLCVTSAIGRDFDGVERLIQRRLPFLAGKVTFARLPETTTSADRFRLQTTDGKLRIEATSPSAAAAAVNHYLREYAHMSLSHNGDNLSHPSALPEVTSAVDVESPFLYRYALNYCTYNYSYSFYSWNDWERELDWMALNGVNLMLAPLGMETVWEEALSAVGLTKKEIDDFISGPAFTAWWLMGNLEGWGGVMSAEVRRDRCAMQKKILGRMRELGMEPVLQGFFGMVPNVLKEKYPDAPIVDQGLWGLFRRPAVLLPGNALFDRLSDAYYRSLRKHYGPNVKFFGGDLFHEGGKTEGIAVAETASLVQQTMLRHHPQATWVLQGWQDNPKGELLAGLDKRHTLVINLAGEISASWEKTEEFHGTPWVWGSVNHFGGKTDMGGQLPVLVGEPHRALRQSTRNLLKGVGILPEGIHANPVVHDFALRTAWSMSAPSVDEYVRSYILSRYGRWDEHAYKAWQEMLASVYGEFVIKGEGTFESIFCARPGLKVTSVSTWGPKQMQYDPQRLVEALVELRRAEPAYSGSATYAYDLVDLARQVLANHGRTVYERSMQALERKDKPAFKHFGEEFMRLIDLQDQLLGTNPHFLLGRWLEQAKRSATRAEDVRMAEKNARTLISYWGPEERETPVHDYANKEWSGFLKDFYAPRWRKFYEKLDEQWDGKEPDIDYFAMETAWAERRDNYPTEPSGDYLACVDRVLNIVRPLYKDPSAAPEERVNDLMKRMTLSEKTAQMKHIHFKHFDNNGQTDLKKLEASTGGMSHGCMEAFPYSSEQYLKAVYAIQKYMREETRLGIPVIPVMEGLHGVVQDGCTVFPQAIAQAATFNPALVETMGRHIATEMKAIGAKQVLSPVLDMARELRWGRVEETFGEDPFLIGKMGEAYVRGIRHERLIPTLKHFIAHGTPTGGLNLASVKGGRRELLDLYVKPFEYVIRRTNPLSVMNCYSSYDREAVTSSGYYMNTLLRDSLHFKGYVYSDWGSIPMLEYFHRTAHSPEEAACQAIKAGIDLEAGSDYYRHAEALLEAGKLDEADIDRAVKNILYAKFASGLFDEPLPDTLNPARNIHTPEAIATAKRLADESIVLLENKGGILPLSADRLSSIAVVGPNADRVQFGDYSWSNNSRDGVTPLEGLRRLLNDRVKIRHAAGCDLHSPDKRGIAEAVEAARRSDLTLVVVGTQSALLARPSEPATSGEGYDLSDLRLPGAQEELIEAVGRVGKPYIVVLVTGKPLVVEGFRNKADALIVQWYGGEQSGNALAEMLFGNVNPSGKLPVSFPKSTGHLPAFYNYLPTDKGYYNRKGTPEKPGRDYVFSDPYAAYPFGYGLSYTGFAYDDLQTDRKEAAATDTLHIRFRLTNTGDRAGQEVPQLYVRDLISSVVTPVKQLCGFEKTSLRQGESRTVSFALPLGELYLHNSRHERVVEPGDFEIQVGSSSEHIHLKDTITVKGDSASPLLRQSAEASSPARNEASGEELMARGTVRNVQAAVMAGVKVTSRNTGATTVTDANGRYRLATRMNDELLFEFEGYRPVRLHVTAGQLFDIEMTAAIR